jgi:hypothetical protein
VIVPAVVLVVAALVVGVAGVLALGYRLPRNRVLGVRTTWTMSSVDAFRRANRAAAPAFVLAGVLGVVGGVAAPLAATTAAAVTVLVLGVVGLVVLLGVGGVVGSRFAEAEETTLRNLPAPGPCTAGEPEEPSCAPEGCASCVLGGACRTAPDQA